MSNIIVATFADGCTTAVTEAIYEGDYGMILQFAGLDLPDVYTVNFGNEAVSPLAHSMIGNADGVEIPNQLLTESGHIMAWVFLHTGEDDGETEYAVTIPVLEKMDTQIDDPTPEQESALNQAIAALNAGVERAETAADSAEQIAADLGDFETAMEAVTEAKDAAAGSASAADQSAQNASQSASSAAASAEGAYASEEAAAQSAERAAASEAAAAGSASDAATSATNAAASEAAAAGSAATAAQELGKVQAEGAAQTAAITAEGEHVLESIPADYTALSEDVSDLKSQTNANTFDINILKSYHKSDLTYADISKIVKAGAAADWFEIGDQIVTTWSPDGTTNYDMPWDVVDIAPVVNADGDTVPGLWLESHWALPGLQFDASEAIYVATETMPAGTYYFTIGTTWGSYCVAGKSYSFTTTVDIPVGGQIVIGRSGQFYTWGAPDYAASTWQAFTFADASSVTPLDSALALTEEATGTSLGTIASNIQAGTTNPNNLQRAAYGYNRYSQSAMRQWLNSDATAGAWWTAQNVFDRPVQQVATMRGFMAGLPADFLAVIKPVKVSTALNTLSDSGGVDDVYDRFFLASLEQEYIVPQLGGVEGVYWPYWKDRLGLDNPQIAGVSGANVNHIRYGIDNHATAYDVRLRSAYRGYASYVWFVYTSGYAGSNSATAASRPAPACVIC